MLLAPNHFHNLGLDPHLARFPEAAVVASERASVRLRGKTRAPILPLAALSQRLPPGVTVLRPEGTPSGEVWLRVPTDEGVAWLVGDAFINLRGRPEGAMGLLVATFGMGPGLRLIPSFKWLALRDRPAYAAWLVQQLEEDPPALIVPAHGDVLRGDGLVERLRALVERRLPGLRPHSLPR